MSGSRVGLANAICRMAREVNSGWQTPHSTLDSAAAIPIPDWATEKAKTLGLTSIEIEN